MSESAPPEQKTCKKDPTHRMKNYPDHGWRCLDCLKQQRRERDLRLKANPADPGIKKGPSSLGERNKRRMVVASLAGAGLDNREIAAKTGMSVSGVEKIVRTGIKEDDTLAELYERARKELAPRAFEIAKKALGVIDEGLDGQNVVTGKDNEGNAIVQKIKPPVHHVASTLRELRPFIEKQGESAEAKPSVGINLNNPAVVEAAIRAMAEWRREQERAAERVIEAERIA